MRTGLKMSVDCDVPLLSVDEVTKRILRLTVTAPVDTEGHRVPLNICLALDKSASMSGNKLETLKQASISLIQRMRDRDMVSVLAFDGTCQLVAPTTTLNSERW